jgi:hypothetical protein
VVVHAQKWGRNQLVTTVKYLIAVSSVKRRKIMEELEVQSNIASSTYSYSPTPYFPAIQ